MPILNGLCLAMLLLVSAAQGADKPPREPLTIEADRAVLDEKKGQSVYTGNVILVQGVNRFQADTLTLFGSEKGKVTKILAQGNPIRFRQKSITDKADITGEALKMQYFATEKRLLLLGSAKLRQGNNQFSGDKIEYDTLRQVVTAEADTSSKARVQVTINPDALQGDDTKPDTKSEDLPTQGQ